MLWLEEALNAYHSEGILGDKNTERRVDSGGPAHKKTSDVNNDSIRNWREDICLIFLDKDMGSF